MQEHDAFREGGQEQMEGTSPSTNPLHDEHVKHVAMLVTALVVLLSLAGFLWFYTFDNNRELATQPPKEVVLEEEMEECAYLHDGEAMQVAISETELGICFCIDNVEQKNRCIESVTNGMLYKNALQNMNPDLCDEMTVPEHTQACRSVVLSGVEFLADENPQALARTYAVSQNEKAISHYESLIETNPQNVSNLIELAFVYAGEALREQENGGNQVAYVLKALEVVEKAKGIDPSNSEVYRAEGYAYEVFPDLKKSIEAYDKAIELNPQNGDAYANRGHASRLLGALTRARQDFITASEFDVEKTNSFIYTNLCSLEYMLGEIEAAIANCTIVLEHEHADVASKAVVLQILAENSIREHKYDQATTYLLQAKTFTPNDAGIYVIWSRMNIYQDTYQEAVQNAQRALELAPAKAIPYLTMAQALYMEGKHELSIQMANNGLGVVENDVSLLISSKDTIRRDLFLLISYNYRSLGDEQRQSEYEQKAKDSFSSNSD